MQNTYKKLLFGLGTCFLLYFGNNSFVIAATTPSLGTAASFGVLTETFTNTIAGTTINGDLGHIIPPAMLPTVNGTTYSGASATLTTATADQGAALTDLNTEPCTFTFGAGVTDLGADTTHNPLLPPGVYEPGVYCTIGAVTVAPLNLSGAGTYIFRIAGAFNTVATTSVILTNGASACDVFWTPVGATTIGANNNFIGTVIGGTAITIGDNVSWIGRALNNAASTSVTFSLGNGTITVPTCSTSTPVCVGTGGSCTDGTTVTVTLLPGDVCIGSSGSFDFGQYIVSSSLQTITGAFVANGGYFFVDDLRGADSGYYTTVQMSGNLLGPNSAVISGVNIRMSTTAQGSAGITLLAGTANSLVEIHTGMASYQSLNTVRQLILRDTAANFGVIGKYGVLPLMQLDIPAYQSVGTYTGTLVYTLYLN